VKACSGWPECGADSGKSLTESVCPHAGAHEESELEHCRYDVKCLDCGEPYGGKKQEATQ
jgi:hypothetical protein